MITEPKVPFVDEVEEFNAVMGKPNNYEPTIPERKEWEFVYNFVLEELEEYREACERGDIVEVLDALCDITYVAVGNCYMALRIRYGQHIKRFKRQIYLKLVKQKKKLKQQSIKEASNRMKRVITKKWESITSFIEQEIEK